MWEGKISGGHGDEAINNILAGYKTLPELLKDINKTVGPREDLTDIHIRIKWRHPLATISKRKERTP